MTRKSQFWKFLALKHLVLPLMFCLAGTVPALAGICSRSTFESLDDFPIQPINIFIPRERSTGAMRLSTQIAEVIRGLTGSDGSPLGLEVNLLTKTGGNSELALDYFSALPPNGYNVVQLNDTYASLVAQSGAEHADLIPISISQIAFSQIYIRTDDPRFTDLSSFVAYAANSGHERLKVARYGSKDATLGLEDVLLDRFAQNFEQRPSAANETSESADQIAPYPLPFTQVGFESGSVRYYSLFDEAVTKSRRTDALIEQPGDVARLIDAGLFRPVFTLLPQEKLTSKFDTRLGRTEGFSDTSIEGCPMLYRFRGFFVHRDIPEDRRRFLEWVFLEAFNSDAFQAINQQGHIDLLYSDEAIKKAYCSAGSARTFFDERVGYYNSCFAASKARQAQPELGHDDG